MALDEKDIELLTQVIDRVITAKLEAAKPVKKPRKPYTRKPKTIPSLESLGIDIDEEHKKIKKEQDELLEETTQKVAPKIVKLRTKVVDENGDIKRGSEASKGRNTIQARVEPFVVRPRPNLFQDPKSWAGAAAKEYERSGEARKDKRIDKVLIGDNQPVQRRGEAVQAEVECRFCGKSYIVPIETVLPDQDNGTVSYTCDSCIRRSR